MATFVPDEKRTYKLWWLLAGLLVIAGPTASGKTSIGVEVALATGGEIVGADSMQIYRFMDIGTAKPTADEQSRVVHHMIDIVDPDEDFDAVRFAQMGRDKVMQLDQKGILPVVAGDHPVHQSGMCLPQP